MECIALDNQPFSVVEDEGFTNLLEILEPRYNIPNRNYFSEEALPALYSEVYNHAQKLLSDAVFISFTTDIWSSSVSQVSMLSLTAQWLDEDFVMRKAVLHSQECRGSHTYDVISGAFEAMFEKWSIPKTKAHIVVRDNARNMAKATVEFGVSSLPCMAHTLQLAVNGGALNQRSISEALAVGRRLVGHFKHSPLACSRLEDVQRELQQNTKRLQQDVSTRWNSTLYMMKSLVEQKKALSVYSTDYELPATLQPAQWALMEKVISALEPFEEITKDISRAEATAADVVPAVASLKRLLALEDEADQGVKAAKRTLLAAVGDRFKDVQTEPLYVIATMVDARFKDRFFDTDKKTGARNMLLIAVDEMTRASDDGGDPGEAGDAQGETAPPGEATARTQGEAAGASADAPDQENDEEARPPKMAKTGGSRLQDMYQQILQENEVTQPVTGGTASEVQAFLGEGILNKKACPFEYWRLNKERFPAIARVARKYLTAPCTSVDSERLFSAVAHIIDEKRNRIHCDNAEMLVFIQKNLHLTHMDKGKKN